MNNYPKRSEVHANSRDGLKIMKKAKGQWITAAILGTTLLTGVVANHVTDVLAEEAATEATAQGNTSKFADKEEILKDEKIAVAIKEAKAKVVAEDKVNTSAEVKEEIKRQEAEGLKAYVVQKGDTLKVIAEVLEVAEKDLADKNGLTEDQKLEAGDILTAVLNQSGTEDKEVAHATTVDHVYNQLMGTTNVGHTETSESRPNTSNPTPNAGGSTGGSETPTPNNTGNQTPAPNNAGNETPAPNNGGEEKEVSKPEPQPEPQPQPATYEEKLIAQLNNSINSVRRLNQLPELKVNPKLTAATAVRAKEISKPGQMNHANDDQSLVNAGYMKSTDLQFNQPVAMINLLQTNKQEDVQKLAESIYNQWFADHNNFNNGKISRGHRRQMMTPGWNEVGTSVYVDEKGQVWVAQAFGTQSFKGEPQSNGYSGTTTEKDGPYKALPSYTDYVNNLSGNDGKALREAYDPATQTQKADRAIGKTKAEVDALKFTNN